MRTTSLLQIASSLLWLSIGYGCGGTTQASPAAQSTTPAADSSSASDSREQSETPASSSVLEQGRVLTARFYERKTAELWPRLSPQAQSAFGSEDKFEAFRSQLDAEIGSETKVLDETISNAPPYRIYLRTASFSKSEQPVIVQWALEADGKVASFFVKPQPKVLQGDAATSATGQGRALTELFYQGKLDELWTKMGPDMQSTLGSKAQFAAFHKQVEEQLGSETKVLDEKAAQAAPYQVYVRTAAFSKVQGAVILQWAFAADGKIAAFMIRPAQ